MDFATHVHWARISACIHIKIMNVQPKSTSRAAGQANAGWSAAQPRGRDGLLRRSRRCPKAMKTIWVRTLGRGDPAEPAASAECAVRSAHDRTWDGSAREFDANAAIRGRNVLSWQRKGVAQPRCGDERTHSYSGNNRSRLCISRHALRRRPGDQKAGDRPRSAGFALGVALRAGHDVRHGASPAGISGEPEIDLGVIPGCRRQPAADPGGGQVQGDPKILTERSSGCGGAGGATPGITHRAGGSACGRGARIAGEKMASPFGCDRQEGG